MDGKPLKILIIDNHDSFTYNLVQMFAHFLVTVSVVTHDRHPEDIARYQPDLIVISAGPDAPEQAGQSLAIIKKYLGIVPIFGVCLGMQCLAQSLGGTIRRAPQIYHGKSSMVHHIGSESVLFKDLDSHFLVGRYHSLCVDWLDRPLDWQVTAVTEDGVIMALENKTKKAWGVQFHPESVLTPKGLKILQNLIEYVKQLS